MLNWYLVHTKIRQEQCALENLERQGFSCFLPMMQIEKVRRGKVEVVAEPLFLRYLFVQLEDAGTGLSWAPIRSTSGVSRLVTFGTTPARASDELIGVLQSQCQAASTVEQLFTPGERVTIKDGAFAGLEAIYQMRDGESRVLVLIDIMSKSARLALPPGSIRKS